MLTPWEPRVEVMTGIVITLAAAAWMRCQCAKARDCGVGAAGERRAVRALSGDHVDALSTSGSSDCALRWRPAPAAVPRIGSDRRPADIEHESRAHVEPVAATFRSVRPRTRPIHRRILVPLAGYSIAGEIMQKRSIGRSELQVAPLVFGGNVFGWTADEPRRSRSSMRSSITASTFIDTADVYSAWVPGNQGGESETIIGKWFKAKRQARQDRARDQGRSIRSARGCRRRTSRRPSTIRCGACKPITSTSIFPTTTTRNAARRDARRVSEAHRGGQGAGDRRVELQRRAARGGACRVPPARAAGVSGASAGIQPVRPRRLRDRSRAGRGRPSARRGRVLQPRERLSVAASTVRRTIWPTRRAAAGSKSI